MENVINYTGKQIDQASAWSMFYYFYIGDSLTLDLIEVSLCVDALAGLWDELARGAEAWCTDLEVDTFLQLRVEDHTSTS